MDYLRFGREEGEKFVILPGLSLVSVMGAAQGIKSAYALLAEKDPEKAQKVVEMFEKTARTYPNPNEIEIERELMETARKAAAV